MAKRRVFISYHHDNEQDIVDEFSRTFSDEYEVFVDSSLERAAQSDDVEYLNQVCRDAIDGTSVTVVLIGTQTGCRKFVDWEIRYTLHCNHGLAGISRPGLPNASACLPDRLRDNLNSGYAKWYSYPTTAYALKTIIDEAYAADKNTIRNGREKRTRNTRC